MVRGWILFFSLFLASALSAADLAPQRTRFQAAWRIAQTGIDAAARAPGLQDYPLYPYLGYERLRRIPDKAPFAEVQAYLEKFGDSMPGHLLRAQLLDRYARTRRFDEFLKIYRTEDATLDLQCHAWTVRRSRNIAGDATAEARAIFKLLDRDRLECKPLLAHLSQAGELRSRVLKSRIEEALTAAQTGLASALVAYLPTNQRAASSRRILARSQPAVALAQARKWPATAASAGAAAIALGQIARKDAAAAEASYQLLAQRLPFSKPDRWRAEAEIARYAAVERLTQTERLLARLPPEAFDDNLREWQVRFHLRRLAWKPALAALEAMPPALLAQSRWRYARARVLELLGKKEDARKVFALLAKEPTFHGFLSADRINAPYAICPASGLLDTERALAVLNLGGIQRALEWKALGEEGRARAEWFWQLPRLTPELRREAGLIASREGLHEWAIFTLNTEPLLRQYEARFPLIHVRAVADSSRQAGLPEHWVFGLIRAESAWNPSVRSPVGARGLMQLMPETAAAVAKSLGTRAEPLSDPAHNIRLGTTYLGRRVRDLGSNPVLATGAYNAGIGAVRRWLAEPLPPWDLWIETVPYKETREYIARVFAFSVLYDWRIDGSPARISALLPGMSDKPASAPVACE